MIQRILPRIKDMMFQTNVLWPILEGQPMAASASCHQKLDLGECNNAAVKMNG